MDKAKSVIARLKNKSKITGNSLQMHLQLFCQEELLRRISLSKYKKNFILKGGLLIYAITDFESRTTVDMDFLLKNIDVKEQKLLEVVKDIFEITTGNDFIFFDIQKTEAITLERKYSGISIHLIGKIGNTKTPIHLDFGVGDRIVPGVQKQIMKTQLHDFKPVEINTYSLESTIAEKFDAIIQRMELNSRMKDFYDIYYLAHNFEFKSKILQEAISQTISNRGTQIDKDTFENIEKFIDNQLMSRRWAIFAKKYKIQVNFNEIINSLRLFLKILFEGIINNKKIDAIWKPDTFSWN